MSACEMSELVFSWKSNRVIIYEPFGKRRFLGEHIQEEPEVILYHDGLQIVNNLGW